MQAANTRVAKSPQTRATSCLALVLCAGATVLAGCQSEPGASTVAASATDIEKPEVEIKHSSGKQSPPIDISYKLLSEPTVGEPLDIELTIGSPLAGDHVDLALRAKGELVMGANQQGTARMLRSAAAKSGGSAAASRDTERVTVIPQAEGRSYLSVMASIPTPEGSVTKVISIPVQVGDLPPRLDVNGKLSGRGDDAVVSMPAKESKD